MKHLPLYRRSLLVAAGVLLSSAALADQSATMTVQANVLASCELSSVPTIDFGNLDPTTDNLTQGDITWVCTNGYDTVIKLDGGGSANILARTMGGAGTLPYQLYTDASRTQVFGDDVNGSSAAVSGVGYASPGTVAVYGRVLQADAATAVAGAYSDTVNVTIVF
jgi:spore coat protein U domain-containing protein, fimbrial subunit CupE1/2/3/6